jgi:hypothetical protein
VCDEKDNKPRVGPKRRLGLPRKEQRKKEREAQKRHRIELHDRKVAVRAPLHHVVSSADDPLPAVRSIRLTRLCVHTTQMKKEAQLKRDDASNNGNGNKKRKRDDSASRASTTNNQSPSAKKQKAAANGGGKAQQAKQLKQGQAGKASAKSAAAPIRQKEKKPEAKKKPQEVKKKTVKVMPFTQSRDPEDAEMAYLEAKLGLTKSGAKNRLVSELADDGFGGTNEWRARARVWRAN